MKKTALIVAVFPIVFLFIMVTLLGGGGSSTAAAGAQCWVPVPAGRWVVPVWEDYTLTSPYGWRADPWTGEQTYHSGTDLAAAAGSRILAAHSGIVEVSQRTVAGELGLWVRIDHSGGVKTSYAHMRAIFVNVGDQVVAGQVIGEMGSTGNSTGPHLHFMVAINGAQNNPETFMAALGIKLFDGRGANQGVMSTPTPQSSSEVPVSGQPSSPVPPSTPPSPQPTLSSALLICPSSR